MKTIHDSHALVARLVLPAGPWRSRLGQTSARRIRRVQGRSAARRRRRARPSRRSTTASAAASARTRPRSRPRRRPRASNAAKECKAERADPDFAATHDGKTFEEFYGHEATGRNAYGKCVSDQGARAEGRRRTRTTPSRPRRSRTRPRLCAGERRLTSPRRTTASRSRRSTARTTNKRNAFGKCVSEQGRRPTWTRLVTSVTAHGRAVVGKARGPCGAPRSPLSLSGRRPGARSSSS